jgi:hypothetical protein
MCKKAVILFDSQMPLPLGDAIQAGLFLGDHGLPIERLAVEFYPRRFQESADHHVEADQQGEIQDLLVG